MPDHVTARQWLALDLYLKHASMDEVGRAMGISPVSVHRLISRGAGGGKIDAETVIPLSRVPELPFAPPVPGPVGEAHVLRWARSGIRRVRLATVRDHRGERFTSEQAVFRFLLRLRSALRAPQPPRADRRLTVGQAVRLIGAPGLTRQKLSLMFHDGVFRDDLCPIVGRRRRIPRSYLPMIRLALIRAGYLSPGTDAFASPDVRKTPSGGAQP